MSVRRLDLKTYRDGVLGGERRVLAKAITLLESTRADDQTLGQELLAELLPHAGQAQRVGVTGPPGVGKSSFIEALGLRLLESGHRVAVLAVDPSSPITKGSILGDKTRMERLAQREEAFIRPSPSGGSLGGVANRTREGMLLCEAAGFDVVVVETVGIGQSEFAVASMVDCFCVLLQPGAGDVLQGLKKGVVELADLLVVTKCDGELKAAAEHCRAEYERALPLLRPASPSWKPRVVTVSARSGLGIESYWEAVLAQRAALEASGELASKRRRQARDWMWTLVEEGLRESFRRHPAVAQRMAEIEAAVEAQEATPAAGARTLLRWFRES
jgi:LAO/AO transport system kinase